MIELSIVIPTLNRAKYLGGALASILEQTFDANRYEIVVVDNGSTDNTRQVVERMHRKGGGKVRYVWEPCPGLHNGRHRGAREAHGEILLYGDDDIIASREWVEGIWESFDDPAVGIAGGKILPEWEEDPPQWVLDLWVKDDVGMYLGYLGLIDLGDGKKFVSSGYTYGCNFAIRKKTLYECGGFHPDGMPQELIRYRGDGETGLSGNALNRGYKILYNPKACVKHIVPKTRMSEDYISSRAFNQGISDSFTEIRKGCGVFSLFEKISEMNSRIAQVDRRITQMNRKIEETNRRIADVNRRVDIVENNLVSIASRNLVREIAGKLKALKRRRLQRGLALALHEAKNFDAGFLLAYRHSLQEEFYPILSDFLDQNWGHSSINRFIVKYILPSAELKEWAIEKYSVRMRDAFDSGHMLSKKEEVLQFLNIAEILNDARAKEFFVLQFNDWLKQNIESDWALQILQDDILRDLIKYDVNSLLLRRKLMSAWREGREYHRKLVRVDENLLKHVLQESYIGES
jgi:glycosyltransferase involved in cell wall biosynthesis